MQKGTSDLAKLHQGLGMRLVHSFLRDLIFYNCSSCSCPFSPVVAAVVSATATSPLKLAATGVPFSKMSGALLVSHGVTDGVSALIPFLVHTIFVNVRSYLHGAKKRCSGCCKCEDKCSECRGCPCFEALLTGLCRIIVGIIVFPWIMRHNPAAATRRALLAYLLKQFLELILEIFPRKLMKRIL